MAIFVFSIVPDFKETASNILPFKNIIGYMFSVDTPYHGKDIALEF